MAQTGYITTVPGLLKIIEAVLCLAGFICAMIPYRYFTSLGGGWVQFVTLTALMGVVAILVLNVAVAERLPPQFPLLMLVFYAVYSLFLFIAGILTAVRAGQIYNHEAVAACAFFVLVAFVVFVIDAVFSFNSFRASQTGDTVTSSSTTQTRTTVTKSTVTVS